MGKAIGVADTPSVSGYLSSRREWRADQMVHGAMTDTPFTASLCAVGTYGRHAGEV